MPITEKSLIAGIRQRASSNPKVKLGIGDDCAVLRLPPGHEVLVTTDFSLEDVHFRRTLHPPEVVGHRCLTRGLSDIAAMGGDPVAIFLSLALPAKVPQSWVTGFMNGLLKLADEFKVPLAGGDTAQSPAKILADIVVVGSVKEGKAILRSGARPGDLVYVTGELGASAATLQLLFSGKKLVPADYPGHFHPIPRIKVARNLRTKRLPSAMIDISDGLSTDLGHICEESGVGAVIDAAAIPLASIGRPAREVDLKYALHGGDDYELLFTAPKRLRMPPKIAGVSITRIGEIRRDRRIFLLNHGHRSLLKSEGWQHFKR